MCGIFKAGSLGSMARTSPLIQPNPSVTSNSRPRSLKSCMPTQMPRNGRPPCGRTVLERFAHPRYGIEPALAVGIGADARQHDAIGAGDILGPRADDDFGCRPAFTRRPFEGLGGGVKISRPVIDDDDALHGCFVTALAPNGQRVLCRWRRVRDSLRRDDRLRRQPDFEETALAVCDDCVPLRCRAFASRRGRASSVSMRRNLVAEIEA